MTDTDADKKVVTSFIDRLFSGGDLTAVDDYLTQDFVNHDPPFGARADREGMRAAASMCRAGFPDWHSEVHLLVAEGDLVAEVFTAGGTHRGEMMGVAPTGQTVSIASPGSTGKAAPGTGRSWRRLDWVTSSGPPSGPVGPAGGSSAYIVKTARTASHRTRPGSSHASRRTSAKGCGAASRP